jgi:hypothetical protein
MLLELMRKSYEKIANDEMKENNKLWGAFVCYVTQFFFDPQSTKKLIIILKAR